MNSIVLLDVLSVVAFGAAMFHGIRIRTPLWDGPARLFFLLSMGIYVLVGLSNVLEHSGITPSFDRYEDHAEILFLPFFLFFLFSMRTRQELNIRGQAEEEMRKAATRAWEEKERFEASISAVGDGVAILDRDFKILYENHVHRTMMGEHAGEFCYRAYQKREAPCEVCPVARAYQDGKIHTLEKAVSMDGRTLHLEITASPLRDSRGAIVAGIEVVRDVTVRRRAEAELRESEERYRLLFESNPHPMWVYDLETLAFLAVNTAAIRHYGYSRNEFLSMTIREIRPPEDVPALLGNIAQVKEGMDEAGVWRHRTKEGRIIDVEITSHTLTFDGRRAELVLAHDVTERRRMEEELLKAQKLESLCILAGGLAHDFNNLLTAVLGNISLAQMYADGDDRLAERLREAERASFRARDLTHQLLTFSRGGEPVKKVAALGPIIAEAADFALRGSRSRCELDLPEDLWAVEVDEGQISQVIHNLVINADQAMPGGGLVAVSGGKKRVRNAEIPGLPAGNYVQITIADRGIGIPQQHVKKIFDPYFTTKQKGSGLGLATSYSILHRHGGHITVASEVGKGTTFALYLPAVDQSAALRPRQRNSPVRGEGRVLVMDDEAMVRDVAANMLAGLGFAVETAKDGEEMLSVYDAAERAGRPFRAVIMDLTVPGGMGGKEAVEKLKDRYPAAKVIVSSGYSNDPVMAEYRAHGFDAVVAKPYTVKNLSEAVAAVLGGERD